MTAVPRKSKKIGAFALANAPDPLSAKAGMVNFEKYTGMEVMPVPMISPGPRRFAGDDASRAKAFNALLHQSELDGLVAIRGGYGVTRILELIDFKALKEKNCFLCGYSDITALLLVAWKYGCKKLIHGPMIQSSWSADPTTADFQLEAESFLNILDKEKFTIFPLAKSIDSLPTPKILKAYSHPVEAPLIPMNLTLLETLLGTPFLPDLTGVMLALEDISEPAHAIDRKLNHLRQTGILQQITGLIFGQFTDAEDAEYLPEIRQEYAQLVHGPVIENFPFGHAHPSIALPFGDLVKLTAIAEQPINLTCQKN